jgi:hypothetical protein
MIKKKTMLEKEIIKLNEEKETLIEAIDYLLRYEECPKTVDCLKFRLKEIKQILADFKRK